MGMSAPCGKICFPTSSIARKAMLRVRATPTGRVPVKVYFCRPCKAWHYTTHAIAPQKRKRG